MSTTKIKEHLAFNSPIKTQPKYIRALTKIRWLGV